MPDHAVQHNPESPFEIRRPTRFFSYVYTKEMIMDCATLSISDPTQNAIDCLKICKVNNGRYVLFFSSKDEVDTPFAPSSFGEDKGNKQNLDLIVTVSISTSLQRLILGLLNTSLLIL